MDASLARRRRLRRSTSIALATLVATVGLGTSAGARPTDADRDGRPNILVVMTDDMARAISS